MSKLNHLISEIEALDIPDNLRRSLTALAVEVYDEAFREGSFSPNSVDTLPKDSPNKPDFVAISDKALNNKWAKENFINYLSHGDYEIR